MTSDYLYLLDIADGKLVKYEDKPEYQELTVSPLGDCFVAGVGYIEVLDIKLESEKVINTEIRLDMIKFSEWNDKKMIVTGDEFFNWANHVKLLLDAESLVMSIISETKKGTSLNENMQSMW